MAKSNAALVGKVHAMYSRRLKSHDWEALLNCSSVTEIAAYLKSNTAYNSVLESLGEGIIHRGDLENLLQLRVLREANRLGRYDLEMGENTANYLLGQMEVDEILHAVIRINSGLDMELTPPNPFLTSHGHFDKRAVDQAKTYDQLLEALRGSRYYKLMLPYRTPEGAVKDYTGLETVLESNLYTELYEVIDHETRGKEQQGLHDLFDNLLDLQNYERIIRLKSYYQVTDAQLRAYLLPFGHLSRSALTQMVEAETPKEVSAILQRTSVGKRAFKLEHDNPGELLNRMRYQLCHRNIHFSAEPSIVMLSYIFLLQTELTALTTLIEGIRYSVSREDIKKLLSPYNIAC